MCSTTNDREDNYVLALGFTLISCDDLLTRDQLPRNQLPPNQLLQGQLFTWSTSC